jgi:hypothetical protein
MEKLGKEYPLGLPSYHPVFDDGTLCMRELKEDSTSWRSEIYPENSNVLVLDYVVGKGGRYCNYNNEEIDALLAVYLHFSYLAPRESRRRS